MKIFVSGFPHSWDFRNLKNYFADYRPSFAMVFKRKGNGFVEFQDPTMALKAIKEMDGSNAEGKRINIRPFEDNRITSGSSDTFCHSKRQEENTQNKKNNNSSETFPYRFAKRGIPQSKSEPPFHDRLDENRFDIAFDIEWTALTPVAANPCDDPGETVSMPVKAPEGEYSGYNRRWLTVENRLAISPFTVKSAIANAVANLLGGCIRVQSSTASHSNGSSGQYPYNGKYKRYRVDMGGASKPGFLKSIENVDGGRKVEIQPAEEFYLDDNLPSSIADIQPGDEVCAMVRERGKKPKIIIDGNVCKKSDKNALFTPQDQVMTLKYHGPYGYGLDMGQAGKNHRHRFYREKPGNLQTGIIPEINFAQDAAEMEKIVYMGQFRDDPARYPGKRWFQPIDGLSGGDPGDWVYYEVFDGKVTNIGRSFLFKALFLHEDTVPEGQAECTDMTCLCPRCAIFGMTDESGKKDRPAVGYGGRFKAAALVSDKVLKVNETDAADLVRIPYLGGANNYTTVPLKKWKSGDDVICRQFLLPIQGAPKPNKRDAKNGAYYDPRSGKLKGVKDYLHAMLTMDTLETHIKKNIEPYAKPETLLKDGQFKYSHKLRNYAQVCREGVTFRGTVGLENASIEEAAALVLCLDSRMAGHGFKIGLGKAFGLGSLTSGITRIWARKPDGYQWNHEDIKTDASFSLTDLKALLKTSQNLGLPDLAGTLADFEKIENVLNQIEDMGKQELVFPQVKNYWKTASQTGLQ